MQIARIGLLLALVAALLGACSQAAQIPEPGGAATSAAQPAAPTADASAGTYPGPTAAAPSAAYPGPTASATDGPLVIPQPSSSEVGVVSGVLLSLKADGTREVISRGVLYLGSLVTADNGAETMVGVNKAVDPQAPLNSRGEFVFVDVPPGRYGLMYDNFQGTLLLNDPETSGDFIIEVAGGAAKSLGELAYPLFQQE